MQLLVNQSSNGAVDASVFYRYYVQHPQISIQYNYSTPSKELYNIYVCMMHVIHNINRAEELYRRALKICSKSRWSSRHVLYMYRTYSRVHHSYKAECTLESMMTAVLPGCGVLYRVYVLPG